MLKIYQNTLKKPVTFEGKGLHTGRYAKIKIFPGKKKIRELFLKELTLMKKFDKGLLQKRKVSKTLHNIIK